MITLAFDTCLEKMYVALGKDNEIDSKIIETTQSHYHSAFLISTIREILINNNLTPNDIDLIAINVGPGSFTGIRACTTVARVFAQGTDTKVVGISSLEVLSRLNKSDKKTLVALDARKEMAYVAIFDKGEQVFAPKTILLSDLSEMIVNDDYFVISDDKLMPLLGGISYQKQEDDLGKYIIEIANEKIKSGFEADWKKLHPLYIQPPPITQKKAAK